MAAISAAHFFSGVLALFPRRPAGRQRLLIGVKGFDLIESGLLRLFRAARRIVSDCLSALRALTWSRAACFFRGGQPASGCLSALRALAWSRAACCVFSAAASRIVSDCLSALRAFARIFLVASQR
jgi:hypothetical protein